MRQEVVARQREVFAHAKAERRYRHEARLRVRRGGVHDLPEQRGR